MSNLKPKDNRTRLSDEKVKEIRELFYTSYEERKRLLKLHQESKARTLELWEDYLRVNQNGSLTSIAKSYSVDVNWLRKLVQGEFRLKAGGPICDWTDPSEELRFEKRLQEHLDD